MPPLKDFQMITSSRAGIALDIAWIACTCSATRRSLTVNGALPRLSLDDRVDPIAEGSLMKPSSLATRARGRDVAIIIFPAISLISQENLPRLFDK
jgi:hypothetical protein